MHVLTLSGEILEATDFFWGRPGELAFPGFVCCRSDSCGCNRAFSGAQSRKAGTVLTVLDASLTAGEVFSMCRASMDAGGWTALDDSHVQSLVDINLRAAARYAAGTLLRPHARGLDEWDFTPV
ncbi:hypothetical protein [Mycolicibacterium sp.]|uniref:DUF7715 family protein n=1 Tax=Mycolicibacterium sp. TaxID=2320850 RepID=UPI00355D7BB4